MDELVGRIKEKCMGKGITFAELEREIGFSNGSIAKSKIEKIQASRLKAIADYFGVTMEYLLIGKTNDLLTGFSVHRSVSSSDYEVEDLHDIDLNEHRPQDTVAPFWKNGATMNYDNYFTIQELNDMGAFMRYDFEKHAFIKHPLTGAAPDRTVPELSDQEQELLRIFRYLNDKDALLKYARFLKDGEKVSEKKASDA